MNLDDESYLSAYLDGELDPADRLAIEWSIESSPALAERLRQVAQARDSVEGLGRPPIPRDLSADLMARLSADRRKAKLRSIAGPARAAVAFSALGAIAASLLVATVLLFRATHENQDRPALADRDRRPNSVQIRPEDDPASRTHPIESHPRATPPSGLVQADLDPISVPQAPPGEARELDERRAVNRILERPNLRRIVIAVDAIDAPERVRALIAREGRKTPEFARITICQGIVVDPTRDGPAEVFAVPMEERIHRPFVERLRQEFPRLVEESGEPAPELVTQLSEVGRVAVFRGTEAAPLGDPPAGLARPMVASRPVPTAPNAFVTPGRSRVDGRASTPEDSPTVASRPASASPHDGDPPIPGDETGSDGMLTVLVWVTRPSRN